MFGGPASAHIHTPTSSYQSNYPPPTSSYQSNYPPPASSYQSNVTPYAPLNTLATDDVHLWMRQEPKEALVCVEGKEKMRKPVDPPPIIQIEVNNRADPMQHFLQSPYLFMCASLWHPENDEPWRGPPSKTLAGSMVSSLHRLKDIDNKDGAFFVFGDISVKQKGKFRLRFSLFDYQKSANAALFLGSVTSKPFVVDVSKDYKGLAESTYLSRAFSDQGVRLRLRKEPRTMMNNKRSYAQVAPPDEDEDRKRQKATHATYPEPQAQVAWYNPPPPQPQVQPSSTAQYNLTPSYNTASDLLSWW